MSKSGSPDRLSPKDRELWRRDMKKDPEHRVFTIIPGDPPRLAAIFRFPREPLARA